MIKLRFQKISLTDLNLKFPTVSERVSKLLWVSKPYFFEKFLDFEGLSEVQIYRKEMKNEFVWAHTTWIAVLEMGTSFYKLFRKL